MSPPKTYQIKGELWKGALLIGEKFLFNKLTPYSKTKKPVSHIM